MAEALTPDHATDAQGFLPGPLGLRLDEEFLPVVALQAPPDMLDGMVPFGQMKSLPDTILLRLWPDRIWACGAPPGGAFRATDISHGYVHLRLRGVEALHFLDLYTRADLFAAPVRAARTLRTRLNHYDLLLWWANTRDVHLLVAQSLAQSFCDHLGALAQRHDPADPSLTPRPVAPDAPERRG